jgi:hypothetical protein
MFLLFDQRQGTQNGNLSTLYENLTIDRILESAPKEETIELKPDDYKMAVDYFSKKM